jgi:drug/metabolite transporter (DMT)-like permease
MKMSLEGVYHWVSVGCMAGAVGLICAGHTVLEPFLQSHGNVVPLLYWSMCAAFGVATAAFAYLALASAQQHLQSLEEKIYRSVVPPSGARFSPVGCESTED